MCFAEPGRVSSVDGSIARVVTGDGICDASLRLVEAEGNVVGVGDWVLIALGLVVGVVDEEEGIARFDEMQLARRGAADR